jgi:single-stranded DNA-binding protein
MLSMAMVIGVIVDQPVLRSYPRGARLQFTLRRERPSGAHDNYTVVAWRGAATRLAEQISQGQTVLVVGDQAIFGWQDDKGQWHRRVELTAQIVRLVPFVVEAPVVGDGDGEERAWYGEEIVDDGDG